MRVKFRTIGTLAPESCTILQVGFSLDVSVVCVVYTRAALQAGVWGGSRSVVDASPVRLYSDCVAAR